MKDWLFTKKHFQLFGFCAILLVVGYILLGQGGTPDNPNPNNSLSLSVAPVILVFVYCVLIPYSIMHGYNKDGKSDGKEVVKK